MEKKTSKIITVAIVSVVVLLLLIAGISYFYVKSELDAKSPDSDKKVIVEIPNGVSSKQIAELLENKDVISSARIFSFYVKYNNSNLKAGNYQLSPSMSVDQIVSKIQSGKTVPPEKLVIPEGYTVDQIASRIAEFEPKLSKKAVLKTMDDPAFVKEMIAKYPDMLSKKVLHKSVLHPLEGYLYPATYEFKQTHPTAEQIIEEMLKATSVKITDYAPQLKKQKKSVHAFLTMSSIIEKEATQNTDRAKIASVFYNRIEVKMPLQTDPTVLYALGKHKTRTYYKDLEVDSPYNTYKNTGLPPGPISNSGVTSMEAALHPAKTDYLYFLANSKTHKVYFSKTLEEHNALKEKHISQGN